MMNSRFLKRMLVGSALLVAGSLPLFATPTLTLSDGIAADTVTIMDNGAGDSSSQAGIVKFNGVLGVWNINVSIGETKPAIGNAAFPQLDISSLNVSTGAGTLVITFSETGFGPTSGVGTSSIHGLQDNGSVSLVTKQNSTTLTSLGTYSSTVVSGSASAAVNGTSYGLTEQLTIVHHSAGVTLVDANFTVPIGSGPTPSVPDSGTTLGLLGCSLTALALFARSR